MAQIRRSLEKKYHCLFLTLETDLQLKSGNMTRVTMTDIKIWHGVNSRGVYSTFRKRLEQLGFWIKTKTDQYMVNPLVMNTAKNETVSILYKIYLSKGGVRIVLDDHLKLRSETTVGRNYETLLVKEYENAMNAAVVKALREKDEAMEAVRKLEKKIDSLQKQHQKDMKIILDFIKEGKVEEIKRHLTLVPDDK